MYASESLSFICLGKASQRKAKAKTGIGKSDLPELQGGPRKRDLVSMSGYSRLGSIPTRRRRKSSIARTIFAGERTRTKSLIFWAILFGPGDQRIARESSSSISVRGYRTKQRRPSGKLFVAGTCLGAVIKRSKICRGCSIRLSGVGSNITGDIIVQPFTRRCEPWIEILPSGPSGNTRSCVDIYAERHTGSHAFRGELQRCLPTGRWGRGMAP